jgi:hypothetical protein
MLTRPNLPQIPGIELPDLDTVCDTFTETFLRAVATRPRASKTRKKKHDHS